MESDRYTTGPVRGGYDPGASGLLWPDVRDLGFAGFRAFRRRGRLADAVNVGGTVAFSTFVVCVVARLITVNLSLDVTSQRLDWQSLMERFKASDFESLRAYANYEYVAGAPFKIFVASLIGAGMGLVGGLCGRVVRSTA